MINRVMKMKYIRKVINIFGNNLPLLTKIEAFYAIDFKDFGHNYCSNLNIATCGQYF